MLNKYVNYTSKRILLIYLKVTQTLWRGNLTLRKSCRNGFPWDQEEFRKLPGL